MILGAGAAGLSAGIYASRGKLDTLILSEGVTGGQMVLTNEIANYPGVETIKGYELLCNPLPVEAPALLRVFLYVFFGFVAPQLHTKKEATSNEKAPFVMVNVISALR